MNNNNNNNFEGANNLTPNTPTTPEISVNNINQPLQTTNNIVNEQTIIHPFEPVKIMQPSVETNTPILQETNIINNISNNNIPITSTGNNITEQKNENNINENINIQKIDNTNISAQSIITKPIVNNTSNNNESVIPTINNINTTTNEQPIVQNTNNNSNIVTNENINMQNNTIVSPTLATSNNNIDDEELLKAYIGKNYDKITTRPFNVPAFFLGPLYMYYRKMFLYGFLIFIFMLLLIIFTDRLELNIIGGVIAFIANKLYIYNAKKKIEKIKIKNQDKDINELKKICEKKGGTSVGKLILGILTQLVVAIIALIITIIVGFSTIINELINLDNWEITESGWQEELNTDINENENNNDNEITEVNIEEKGKEIYVLFIGNGTGPFNWENNNVINYDYIMSKMTDSYKKSFENEDNGFSIPYKENEEWKSAGGWGTDQESTFKDIKVVTKDSCKIHYEVTYEYIKINDESKKVYEGKDEFVVKTNSCDEFDVDTDFSTGYKMDSFKLIYGMKTE